MKSTTLLLATTLCCPIWAQQESIPPEIDALFQKYCEMAHETLPILKKVTDKTSADAAAIELYSKLTPLFGLREQLTKLDKLSPELSQAISSKYELPMRQSWGDVYAEIFRLQKAQCFASIKFAKQLQAYCTILNQ